VARSNVTATVVMLGAWHPVEWGIASWRPARAAVVARRRVAGQLQRRAQCVRSEFSPTWGGNSGAED